MVVEITRDNRIVTIVPDNVVHMVHMVHSPYCKETPWGCVMSSGDIVYITEDEKKNVDEALRLRDEQIEKLIENTTTIIEELGTLNGTAVSINGNVAALQQTPAQQQQIPHQFYRKQGRMVHYWDR